jgi:hypothetical protein
MKMNYPTDNVRYFCPFLTSQIPPKTIQKSIVHAIKVVEVNSHTHMIQIWKSTLNYRVYGEDLTFENYLHLLCNISSYLYFTKCFLYILLHNDFWKTNVNSFTSFREKKSICEKVINPSKISTKFPFHW